MLFNKWLKAKMSQLILSKQKHLLKKYLLPLSTDLPEITTITLEESPSKLNPMGLKGAGERHDFPAALLFGEGALMIARGAAGAVEQGAERSDQQYAKGQGHVAPRRGAPAPVLFIDHVAFRHIPLH